MRAPAVSDEAGEAIVRHARRAVAGHLGAEAGPPGPEPSADYSGVFVTISKSGGLRGCIGFTSAAGPLSDSVAEAAVAAAVSDPRFEPVSAGELDTVTFEVTVLSPAERLSSERAAYPLEIEVGRHGLVVSDGERSGLLLPQVATEYGWDAAEFLDRTCEKAGLERRCWMDDRVSVSRFLGTIFRETAPGGCIVRA